MKFVCHAEYILMTFINAESVASLQCFTVEERTVEQWRILEMEAMSMKPAVLAANGNVQ